MQVLVDAVVQHTLWSYLKDAFALMLLVCRFPGINRCIHESSAGQHRGIHRWTVHRKSWRGSDQARDVAVGEQGVEKFCVWHFLHRYVMISECDYTQV